MSSDALINIGNKNPGETLKYFFAIKEHLLALVANTLVGLRYLPDSWYSVCSAYPAVLGHSLVCSCHLVTNIPMALDVAAEHVVEAEQGGCQEEEPGGKIIMETEGDIIYLYIIFWPGLEETSKAHDCPKNVDHDLASLTSLVIIF